MAQANSICSFVIMGPVGRDAELMEAKKTKTVFAVLSIATHSIWLRKNKEPQKHTSWHRVTVWGDRLARFTAQRVKKGMMVAVSGEIFERKYTHADGSERKVTDLKADTMTIVYPPKRKQEDEPAPEKKPLVVTNSPESKDPY